MAKNMVHAWTKSTIAQGVPARNAAGGAAGAPVRNKGINGVNLWGTGAGVGIPATNDSTAGYAMLAEDGSFKHTVVIAGAAVTENDPIYITSGNTLTSVATSNTLFGYADEPAAIGTVRISVRTSNAV